MTRWQRYWFDDGGRTSAAVVRIAIAAAVLMTLQRLATLSTVHIPGPAELYRPVGIWMLFGHLVPPGGVVAALWGVAIGATVLMLVGLWSRASTAVSFVTAIALTSASFASSASWSHQYNVVFLAQLAFLGARGGDTLSLDAVIRRRRGLPPLDAPRGYQWSVRLVQLAVALMFAGAAFHKLLHGHFTLHWALSDNLRHQLLVRYDLAGLPRPAVADWIIDDVWRFRTAAVLNLLSQAAPILACIFVRRPLVRALAGGFFVLEVVALGLVVDLWNPHWLPLAAAFIDWDRLAALALHRPATARPPPPGWTPPAAARRFIIAFVIYDAITALVPTLDQRLNTYPFSGFPMFATVRAREPYNQHQPYAVPGDHFEVISARPPDEHAQRWIDHRNRRLYLVTDPVVFRKRLAAILADVQARFPELGIRGLRHYLTIFEAPAYPAAAHFEPHPIAIMGELDDTGRFRSALGTLDDTGATLQPQNLDAAGAHLVVYTGDDPTPHDLPATRSGDRFVTGPIAGDPLYVVAIIEGAPWLVATRRAWRWE
ncbi:MAG: hypothetical protein E6J90_12410 [Deltaproteobacteria bacterium]|nr:MAG: hypothetical protein E6J90_12410 [Deltaproteobacteria bacterium]